MMRDISDEILQKIKEKHIEPTPKWHFVFKNLIVWTTFLISIVVGGLSFSAILHFLSVNDWDVYPFLGQSLPEFIAFVLPYFWIFFLFLFLAIAYYDYRHTKGAYKYRGYAILTASFTLSLAIGLYFFFTGIASETDKILNKNLTFYQDSQEMMERVWQQPEKGMVIGTVVTAVAENATTPSTEKVNPVAETEAVPNSSAEPIIVKDCDGKVWKVTKTEKAKKKEKDDESKKKSDKKKSKKKKESENVGLSQPTPAAQTVKIIGSRRDDCDDCIDADEIRYSNNDDDDDDEDEDGEGDRREERDNDDDED